MGSYDSRALFLSDFINLRQANKLDNGSAACVPIIPQEQASQISPIHLPQALYSRWQGGEGARRTINNQITMTTYVGGNGNDDDGNSDDGNGDDGKAAAKKTTTTYGDGDNVHDGDGRRRRWRR